MEKDNEINGGTGNSYDFGARLYDPRVGRWLSIDPLAIKYPAISPYTFTADNPILFVDVNGEDFIIRNIGDRREFKAIVKATFGGTSGFSFGLFGRLKINMNKVHVAGLEYDQRYVLERFNVDIVTNKQVKITTSFNETGITYTEEKWTKVRKDGNIEKARLHFHININQPDYMEKMTDTHDGTLMKDGTDASPVLLRGIGLWHEVGHEVATQAGMDGDAHPVENNRMSVGFENIVRGIFGMNERLGTKHGEKQPDESYKPEYQGSQSPPQYDPPTEKP